MIRFLSLLAILFLLSSPAVAQEEEESSSAPPQTEEVKAQNDGDPETRLKLSQKMHEIWPIRQKIEGALDVIAERIPEKERVKFKAAMRKSINFEEVEKASIDAMADIFSEKELNKMIDFYGSKEGRSVSHKTGDYEKALQPLMIKMLDKALLDAKMGKQSVPKK